MRETSVVDERAKAARKSLEDLRKRLLDLSNRNRLLNYRHTKIARQVRIVDTSLSPLTETILNGTSLRFAGIPKPRTGRVDAKSLIADALELARVTDEEYLTAIGSSDEDEDIEKAEQALERRVREQLGLGLRSTDERLAEEIARNLGIDTNFELSVEGKGPAAILQTLLFDDDLERKLSTIHDEARTSLQELGINTLYCAFSFLEWYESDDSNKSLLSPLILVPVQLSKVIERGKYCYVLAYSEEESESNITLAERLQADFHIKLPQLDSDVNVSDYLRQVEEAIESQERWKIRTHVTLGLFNFTRLAMYRDLDPNRRPENAQLEARELILDLLGGLESWKPGTTNLESEGDNYHEYGKNTPAIIWDADASQFRAICEALSGRSFVIEGPPGTGKSQTITNIIAAALNQNKKVLFVAEKLAALQVVKNRLDAAGLGEFCLELHSTKSRKSDVQESLRQRFRVKSKRHETIALEDIKHYLSQLERYTASLHEPVGKLGQSVFELIWREQRLRLELGDGARTLQAIVVPGAQDTTPLDLKEVMSTLSTLVDREKSYADQYGAVALHPLRSLLVTTISQSDLAEMRRSINESVTNVQRLEQSINAFRISVPPLDWSWGEVIEVCELRTALSGLPATPVEGDVVRLLEFDDRKVLASLGETLSEFKEIFSYGEPEARESLYPPREDIDVLVALFKQAGCYRDDTFDSITNKADSLEKESKRLSLGISLAAELAARVWPDEPLTKGRFDAINHAVMAVCGVDEKIVSQANDASFDRTKGSIICDAAMRATNLRKQLELMACRFEFSAVASSKQLGLEAAALENRSLFAFLSPKLWSAKAYYRRIARSNSSTTSRVEMASGLRELQKCAEEVERFNGDVTLRQALGGEFTVLQTDLEHQASAAHLATLLRAKLEVLGKPGSELLKAIIANPSEVMSRLSNVADDRRYQYFHEIDVLVGSVDTLESEIVRRQNVQTVYTEIRKLWSRSEVSHALTVNSIEETHSVGKFLIKAREAIADNPYAASFFGTSVAQESQLKMKLAALAYHALIDNLNVDESIKTALRSFVLTEALFDSMGLSVGNLKTNVEFLEKSVELDIQKLCAVPLQDATLGDIGLALQDIANSLDSLPDWLQYRRVRTAVERLGLGDLVEAHSSFPELPVGICYEYAAIRTLLQDAHASRAHIAEASGLKLGEARERFQDLDRRFILANRIKLCHELLRREIPEGNRVGNRGSWTERALLENEMQKSKRHVPIRDLMRRAGAAMQAAKPCFMMSPLSVSQFLDPTGPEFDLLIIDEASQMRPEDALGALSRARQIIVVGDPKQLPPTTFFDRLESDTEVADEDAVEVESILDLASQQYRCARRLTWHYRSRHESLIAFSNRHFYDNELLIVPSPESGPDLGVRFAYTDGRYKGRVNEIEARSIVRRAVEIMRHEPSRSLAIVAMNQPQRDLIRLELERALTLDAAAQQYEEQWGERLEPLIVKNLESIQGDERDVVLISTVYGRDASGNVYQRFGPINSREGWRRLNVLFTRAKCRVEVFSSMRSSDILVDEKTSRGARALRDYLEYSATGMLDAGEISGRPPDSDFELAVARMLEGHGYKAVPQVGVAGFFIDIGVLDPATRSKFILGIECDGSVYHSTKSARDRDRLREDILKQRGWRLHRIWSTDWFSNPQREVKRLIDSIEKARTKGATPRIQDESERNVHEDQVESVGPLFNWPKGQITEGRSDRSDESFSLISDALEALRAAVPTTGSITRDRLLSEAAKKMNQPLTKQTRSTLNKAISQEVRTGRLRVDNSWTTIWRT